MTELVDEDRDTVRWTTEDEDDKSPLFEDDEDTGYKFNAGAHNDSSLSSGQRKLLYVTFVLLGMGSLLPYNMFINASEYFNYKLREVNSSCSGSSCDYGDNDDDDEDESKLQQQFESYFTTFSTISLLFMVWGNTLLVHALSSSVRLIGSLLGVLLAFLPSLCLVKVDTQSWQNGFFAITIANIVVLNVVSATLQSATMGVAALISLKYTQAAIAGQAVAGVFSAIAQIGCLAVVKDEEDSALLYFLVAEGFIFILLVLSLLLLRNPVYIRAQNTSNTSASLSSSSKEVWSDTRTVFLHTMPIGLSLAHVFFVTLVLFPNFMVHIEPTHFNDGDYWYPVTVFLLFNLLDLVGRSTAGWLKWPSRTSFIVVLCMSRTVFLVLYLFTNFQTRHNGIPVYIENDWLVQALNILMAFSNGYCASICFMYGARNVPPRAHLVEQAGAVLTFYLSLGLCGGSAFSFLYIKIP